MERLVDESGADELTRALGMFIPFAATMVRWEAVRKVASAPARAHLRIAALELASKMQLLRHARVDFGIGDSAQSPDWLDPARRCEPLLALRTALGNPTLRDISESTQFSQHTVGRWFSKGERPSREALQVLAKYFAKALQRDWHPIYRDLYWHYSLGDALRRLDAWIPPSDVNEIANVCTAVARCRGQADLAQPPPAGLLIAGSLVAPAACIVEHAIGHGASPDWAADAEAVRADFQRAGVDDVGSPTAQLGVVLDRLPRRRGARRPSRSQRAG